MLIRIDISHLETCHNQLVGLVVDEAHYIKNGTFKYVAIWHYRVFYTFRGKDFRKEYGHLGEMRGLLNTSVNVMALTATATKQTRKDLCKPLCLLNPVMILESPEKSNIVYSVLKKVADIRSNRILWTREHVTL